MSKKVDLRNLDTSNPASWPFAVKLGACALLGLVIIGLSWYFFVADRRSALEGLERNEVTLRDEFQDKQGRAANLEPLKQQLSQMELRMVGSYHQFGAFVSGVASLPRVVIMTMHDISLKPKSDKGDALELSGTVKTYRYLDDEEVAEAEKKAKEAAAAQGAK